ncbi:hypothetical protein N7468_001068 [Penicillium chermesinum]|uniref:Uncharacterized protein n=1 Tax=Penicillium chermesinum TaxID=63820 RepID=A0A9W9TWF5_9EURO|nr:uncharacterized protein N7468_001068 [Penicillium chermesinum]KAJ5246085.1 hypothetical protein N7468_001068 [Penicillium chermesinum]
MLQESEASIIRIAGAGFRLSLLLNAAACQLAQSRIEFHSIAKAISLFSLTLKRVGKLLDATTLGTSPTATEKALEIASQGQVVMVEIEHMLEKLQGTDTDEELRKIPPQELLHWCFRKQHVTYLLAQLESLKLSLIVMFQVLQLAEMVQSNSGISGSPEFDLTTDEMLAQEKAEAQNMVIIRYWAVRRVDHLWGLVEQEAVDAAKNPISQRINSASSSKTVSAVKSLVAAANGSTVTRLHTVTFGDVDSSLGNLERSPKEMVHLSEKAIERLFHLWVPSLDISWLHKVGKNDRGSERSTPPRVHITPESDNDSEKEDFDRHSIDGYYLEGNTTDWRKPHSQEARYQAAQLRQRYSGYQAYVDNDSETDDDEQYNRARNLSDTSDSGDDYEQRSASHRRPVPGGRPHSNSMSSKYSSQSQVPELRQPAYPNGSIPPAQSIPRPRAPQHLPPGTPAPRAPGPLGSPAQPGSNYYADHTNMPRSVPMSINTPQRTLAPMPIPSPRSTPPNSNSWGPPQAYSGNPHARYHHSAYPLSTSSPETRHEVHFRTTPPRSAQRTPPSDHSRRSSRELRREANKELGRTATRGLVGIGAIAGFMDALEAFQLL